ncbi:2-keto-4-pentenoate hydratase [hydrothermal vent metagenome]|uniref:2-keto-4-pentenoate hydratase n=1 Tax=hydrothermal vent metagenome TaxID=652676 RepID=A0A1W1CWW3_9ZZZZ
MRTITYNNQQPQPSKVVCIGRNYVEHIEELGNEIPSSMVVFNKPNSAISEKLYYFSEYCRFEGEICFLIHDHKIAGVGFGLDLTHADIQNHLKSKGLPWERAKAFDNSAVLSEFVPICDDLTTLNMKLYINDKLIQFATYELMMYKPNTMLSEIESFMSLEDNDIIMSGTPKGVGTYAVGDRFLGQVFSGDELLVEGAWVVQ